ncbi:MAG: hypothetical protein ACLQMO_02705 [Acidobacteriaceae bacterium]
MKEDGLRALDKIARIVLAYHPKPKSKAAKKREHLKNKKEKSTQA